jgi:hypothetical protein
VVSASIGIRALVLAPSRRPAIIRNGARVGQVKWLSIGIRAPVPASSRRLAIVIVRYGGLVGQVWWLSIEICASGPGSAPSWLRRDGLPS